MITPVAEDVNAHPISTWSFLLTLGPSICFWSMNYEKKWLVSVSGHHTSSLFSCHGNLACHVLPKAQVRTKRQVSLIDVNAKLLNNTLTNEI